MITPEGIRDAVTVVAIVTACALAWLSVRTPRVMSRWRFWSAIAGLLVVVAAPMQRRRLLQASQGSPGFTRSEPGRSNASATAACTAPRGNAPTLGRLRRWTRQAAQ